MIAFNGIVRRYAAQRLFMGRFIRKSNLHSTKVFCNNVATEFDIKPFEQVPLVKNRKFKNIIDFIRLGPGKLYLMQKRFTEEYGPIYRQQIPTGEEVVFISNPVDFETVLTNESRDTYQSRSFSFWSMKTYAEKYNKPDHLLNLENEEFFRRKDAIKKALMAPKEVAKLTVFYDDITKDLIEKIEASKNISSNIVDDVFQILQLWSFECAGATTFHTRFDVLKVDGNIATDPSAQRLFDIQDGYLEKVNKLEILYKDYYQRFPSKTWNWFENFMRESEKLVGELYDRYGEYVTDKKSDLSDIERLYSCITVLQAAVDTTSATALWSLVELSKYPEVQEKICNEVQANAPDNVIDGKVLQKLKFTRACLKEVMRKSPIILFTERELNSDLILSGYKVPAGKLVVLQTGFVNQFFPVNEPDEFQAERWMKESSCPVANKPHPFYSVQFGHGARSCIGRRLAENELYTFYANIFSKYKVKRANDADIKAKNIIITIPVDKVSLVFEKR